MHTQAQYENVWIFGEGAGLDFNSGFPTYNESKIEGFGEASASICDGAGKLLFYTEGSHVWDRNGNKMPNGIDLLPIISNTDFSATSSSSQGAIIVPIPHNQNKYYIFSLTSVEQNINKGRLYYSVVDMTLNNGTGDVIPAEKGRILDSNLTEKMTAVAGNRCNVWLVVTTSSTVKSFEIDGTGVAAAPVVSLNNIPILPTGNIAISPNGTKLAITNLTGSVYLCDYDIATGKAENPVEVSGTSSYGACFSNDNTKLYTCESGTTPGIQQYNLRAADTNLIKSSRQTLGIVSFTNLKMAPDGKIYFVSNINTLGCIDFPDNAGPASGFRRSAFQFPGAGRKTGIGLPNVVPLVQYATSYRKRIINAPCFSNAGSFVLTVDTPGWGHLWQDNSTESELKISEPGIYGLRYYTSPCTMHIDTFEVRFPYGMLPSLHTTNNCKGQADGKAWLSTFYNDTVSYHYFWQNENGDTVSTSDTLSNISAGQYYVRITTTTCDTVLQFSIREEQHRAAFSADSLTCEGHRLAFENTSDNYYTTFHWTFGDGNMATGAEPTHSYAKQGLYNVRLVATGNKCTDTAYGNVLVDPKVSIPFSVSPDSICVGMSASLIPTRLEATATRLYWNFGDGNDTYTSKAPFRHTFEKAGVQPLTLTVQYRSCPETNWTESIYIEDLPRVDLGPDTTLCLNGKAISLKNKHPVTIKKTSHHWNTGDSTTQINISQPGTYSLTLTNTYLGCKNTASIQVNKGCSIDIPNVFTPNGDGINDYFFPRPIQPGNIKRFHMQIFNRWGQTVFETHNINGQGWNGSQHGQEQPEGAYVYLIDLELESNKTEAYKGNLILIR